MRAHFISSGSSTKKFEKLIKYIYLRRNNNKEKLIFSFVCDTEVDWS